jgi:hypothetical protein
MSWWATVFMWVWFAFVGVMGVVSVPGLVARFIGAGDREAFWSSLHLVGMALLGWALVRFGRWLGRNEEVALQEWLRDLLSGVEVR